MKKRNVLSWPVLVFFALAGFLYSGDKPKEVKQSSIKTKVATIEAIDSASRMLTLKYEDGNLGSYYVTPEVKRFEALKVGDRVTFQYEESVVYRIQKPGAKAKPSESKSKTESPGPLPGGTTSQVLVTTVKVEAIDWEAPSITVSSGDGSRQTFPIKDKANLQGVKVGDRIEITYTQAVVVNVESPAK